MAVTSFDAFVSSLSLVALSEMGDKTQLLAFSLAARYRKALPILAGILVATLLNHAVAAYVGVLAADYLSPKVVAWVLTVTFFGCAIWALIPDKLEELPETKSHSIFITTVIVFFLAEMGDKTQLATVALGARYDSLVPVTLGTTVGMMLTNSLAVFAGDRLANYMRSKSARYIASGLFFVFGIVSLIQALAA